jgi:hypothetical protein
MFDKICNRCNNKIKKNYEFCPFCGNSFKNEYSREDYGLLGKTDVIDEPISPGFGDTMIEKVFNQTMKILEKQMKNMAQEMNQQKKQNIPMNNEIRPSLNIQFSVAGKNVFQEENKQIEQKKPETIKVNKMSEEKLLRFSKLKKIEPKISRKRLGQRLIYELEVPGVNDIDDILINRLENSIEIKALAKDVSYSKIIKLNLPIIKYGLDNGNIILELQVRS